MIQMAKWRADDGLAARFLLANAVSNDVRLAENTLSVWVCDPSDSRSIEDVVLALASGRDSVAKLDIVWIGAEEVKRILIDIEEVSGGSRVATLNDRHRDLKGIDIVKLVRLGRRIAEAVGSEKCKRFTEKQVLKLIVSAINSGRLQLDDLNEKMRKKIGVELNGRE
jgi:hypothetical protein